MLEARLFQVEIRLLFSRYPKNLRLPPKPGNIDKEVSDVYLSLLAICASLVVKVLQPKTIVVLSLM